MRSKIRALIFLVLLCVNALSAQQSNYLIRNYLPKEYGGFNQMWDATQDRNGLLYFGCTSNVFTFDGKTFEKIPIKVGGATRRVYFDTITNTVYVGTVSDFGYLQRAFNGEWKYISLLPKIPEAARQFTDIWEIHPNGEEIYFESSERIFILKKGEISGIIEAPEQDKRFALMFKAKERIYVRQRNVGLCDITDGTLKLVAGGALYANVRILNMLSWNEKQNLIITGDQGLALMNLTPDQQTDSSFVEFPEPADDFLLHAGVLGGEWINDSLFAIASRNGAGIYTRAGKLITVLDKAAGVSDVSIAAMFIDREKNLWLMHNNGITRVAINSPVRYYADNFGLNGAMEMCVLKGDSLYVATTQGLYIRRGEGMFSPSRIPNVEVWSLLNYGGDILAGTTNGLARTATGEYLTPYNVTRIVTTPVPGELITTEKGAIGYYRIEPFGKITSSHVVELNDDLIHLSPVDTVAGQSDLREFWCTTRFSELLHVSLNVNSGEADIRRYNEASGWNASALYMPMIGDSIYFFKNDSAFRYLPEQDAPGQKCFAYAPDMFAVLASGDLSLVHQPFDSHLFLSDPVGPGIIVFGEDSAGQLIRKRVLANHFYGTGSAVMYGTVTPSGSVLLMSSEILTRIDPEVPSNQNTQYHALIRRVIVGADSVIFYGSDNAAFVKDTALLYRNNSISFHYSAPFFDYEDHIQFSYILEGYDTSWSKWSAQTFKDYTNLPEGTYTFKVKATNTYNVESEIASYTFTILPPWYRTTWAYAGYIVALILFVFACVRISAGRLRRQKEKLERTVAERTAEVVEQSRQIEAQKADLESAYEGIQDSIHYSQRIQQAILPTQEEIRRIVPDSFVIFYPRDIVSGDFYWFAEKAGKKFIACVDCTGHGVPGALMSMIGNTLLNQIIIEKNILSPDEILNQLHVGVRHALKQDAGGDTRDGMDLALIVLGENGASLEYAGANRSLWIVRDGELLETKADKFPIAGSQLEDERRFRKHTVALVKGDVIYLSTDGFADQFGGPKGKKFMVKQFTHLLCNMYLQPMAEQKSALEHAFNQWKGPHEQVDDVLVIGIRV